MTIQGTKDSYESMQFLADASIALNQALSQGTKLDKLFIRAQKSKMAFEPKLAGRFSQIRNLVMRAVKPKALDLEKHLLVFKSHFEAASKLKPEEYAKLQATYKDDLESMVNTFKAQLEAIQKHAAKQLSGREKASRIGAITFCRIATKEVCLKQLEEKLNSKAEKLATALLTSENPKLALAKEFSSIKGKVIPEHMRVDTAPIEQAFSERVMQLHAAGLAKLESEFQEMLHAKLATLLAKAQSAEDLDGIIDKLHAFIKKKKPPGLHTIQFDIPESLLTSKKEALKNRALAKYEELLKNELDSMVENPKKFTSLNEMIEKFKEFAKRHKPADLSEEECTAFSLHMSECKQKELSEKLAKAFKALPRDQPIFTTGALAKSIAQISFELYMKGSSGLQSSIFLFTLAAPYLTTYASNKLLPDTIVPVTVRNFVQSFSTLWLYREAFPTLLASLKRR